MVLLDDQKPNLLLDDVFDSWVVYKKWTWPSGCKRSAQEAEKYFSEAMQQIESEQKKNATNMKNKKRNPEHIDSLSSKIDGKALQSSTIT